MHTRDGHVRDVKYQVTAQVDLQKVGKAVGDRFAEEAIQSAANAWNDDILSLRERSLIVIAALIAQGDLEAQLRMHTRWALDHGATLPELDELATLLAIYSGFARASRGLMIIRDELSKLLSTSRTSGRAGASRQ